MSILNIILEHKRKEVEEAKSIAPTKLLEKSIYFNSQPISLESYLKREDRVGIIAEIKRKSPSTGFINGQIDIERLSIGYMQSGASALSVLTDYRFFGGQIKDLETARKFNYCPILRKDFIIDEYQVIESKSIGADCILLIAACLSPQQCKKLAQLAQKLGMEVLLEIRTREEIETHLNPYINIIGVNNRNLKTFETHIQKSIELSSYLPNDIVRISESGITSASQIQELQEYGYHGFLIGGYFMKHEEPDRACMNLIHNCKSILV